MKRKLLFVANTDWFFLSHRLPIAIEALQSGYDVHVACGITDKFDELRRHGLVVHPLSMNRSSASIVNAGISLLQLWRVFRSVCPDIVHLVTIKPVLLGGVVARLAGVPAVVAAVSGLGFVFTARGVKAAVRRVLVSALYRLALGHLNIKVIFQNPDDASSIAKMANLPNTKIVIIRGSGVNLNEYDHLPLPEGVPVVVLAARLLADKGVREFAQAARMLKKRGCVARYVLVGTVDLENPSSLTQAELDAWADEGIVELWGYCSNMSQVFSAANIVTLPSYREGLPKVLLEAAACGRVVVTTDVPGCREAIEIGITGVLVPVRDVAALANAIEALINDFSRCQTMGDAGRLLAEIAFDVRQVVEKHLNIYEELINKQQIDGKNMELTSVTLHKL